MNDWTPHHDTFPVNHGIIFGDHFIESETYYTDRPNGMLDWLIFLTLDGCGYFTTPEGHQTVSTGDYGLLRSGVPHRYGTLPGQQNWDFLWVHFPHLQDITWLPDREVLVQHITYPQLQERIQRAFVNIIQDARGQSGLKQQLCENGVRELLLIFGEAYRISLDRRIEQTQQMMSERLKEPLRIDDLAAEVGLSTSRLSHLYKMETGQTILDSFNQMRVRQAALLISHSGRTALQASLDVGFQNYNHFSALFRRYMGARPKEYRGRNQIHYEI